MVVQFPRSCIPSVEETSYQACYRLIPRFLVSGELEKAGEKAQWHSPMRDSVVVSIVTFNGRHFLKECLKSVLSQTYAATEVYLFDNASTDGTVELVAQEFGTVKLISSDVNIGFGAGHNRVIKRTESSFVLVVNQDAFLDRGFLEELMAAVSSRDRVGIAGGKLLSSRTNGSKVYGEPTIDMT